MVDAFLGFLRTYGVELSAAGGLAGVAALIWAIVKWPFSKPKPTQLAPDTIDQIKPPQAKDGPALTVPEFIRLRRELKADLEAELAEAAEAEKSQLRARIAELEKQIANPDEALAEAQKRIADLEALLDREANQIGADRIVGAKAALEQGDYSLADDIFAEIEAQNELAVQETARAAYGRGEVAEAEVRWGDAYTHYANAARLDPSFENLLKAREYAWRAGQFAAAHRHGEALLEFVRKDGTQEQIATALNEHALTVEDQGRYGEAEGPYREALEIGRTTIGEGHPSYAIRLNNLAGVLVKQGKPEEARPFFEQALEILRVTLPPEHPYIGVVEGHIADLP